MVKLSVCIPRLDDIITKEYIISTFRKLDIGNIRKFKEIPLHNNENYKRVIFTIHVNDTENGLLVKQKIENNETIKIVHDMPWYWKLHRTTCAN